MLTVIEDRLYLLQMQIRSEVPKTTVLSMRDFGQYVNVGAVVHSRV